MKLFLTFYYDLIFIWLNVTIDWCISYLRHNSRLTGRKVIREMNENEEVRLNKFLSSSGVCSRREADRMLAEGRVSILVNGSGDTARTAGLGARKGLYDRVFVDGKEVKPSNDERLYLMLNKPKGIICTGDRRVKENIIDYAGLSHYISYAGRLDRDSTGLVLLTNDGELNDRIMRAVNRHEKEYLVRVDKCVTEDFLIKMRSGITIVLDDDRHMKKRPGDGKMVGTTVRTRPCKARQVGKYTFLITLTQGYNRQIRRMCAACGYSVLELRRIRLMNLELGALKEGMKRFLTKEEIAELRKQAGLS